MILSGPLNFFQVLFEFFPDYDLAKIVANLKATQISNTTLELEL